MSIKFNLKDMAHGLDVIILGMVFISLIFSYLGSSAFSLSYGLAWLCLYISRGSSVNNDFNVGDLVYRDKYHRGLLEVVEVHDDYVVVGKYSRIGIPKNNIRHGSKEELSAHYKLQQNFKQSMKRGLSKHE